MKIKRTLIILFLIIVNISLLFFCCYRLSFPLEFLKVRDCVNQETALKIAQVLCENEFGIYLEDKLFEIKYFKESNEYNVFLKNYLHDTKGILDYHGVYISAENCRITDGEFFKRDLEESYYGRTELLEESDK